MGTLIEVRERNGVPELYLDGYPQTQQQYRQDWAKLLRNTPAERTLLLGLGGGDVVTVLTKQHTNKLITAVEIEPGVVEVAGEYFGMIPSAKLSIVTADAERFMERNKEQYDLAVVDLYSGDGVPKFVESAKFLENVRAALSLRGTIVINYASHSFGRVEFEGFETTLRKIFARVEKRVIWGHTFYKITN
jgi:spermidine synthase